MMIRSIALLLAGAAIGAIIIYGAAVGFKNPFPAAKQISKLPPAPTSTAAPQNAEQRQKALDNLRKQLYQQGITVSVTVDNVYPGTGFTVRDNAGTILFVEWNKTAPEIDQKVSIKGTIEKVADKESELRDQPGFTSDLEDFLKNQQILIHASEVTLTSS